MQAVSDDLNMPQALAVVQEVLKSKIKDEEKLATILDFDKVLGFNLAEQIPKKLKIKVSDNIKIVDALFINVFPSDIGDDLRKTINLRQKARENQNYKESDRLRAKIEKQGYIVEDTKDGQRIYKK